MHYLVSLNLILGTNYTQGILAPAAECASKLKKVNKDMEMRFRNGARNSGTARA